MKSRELQPTQVLAYSFFFLIILGGLLLSLPISSSSGEFTPFIDSLFTATSALCVTGLTVVETAAHWNTFGKSIILLLIQIGGLGIMTTVSIGIFAAGSKVSLHSRFIMKESFGETGISGVVRLTRAVLLFTFSTELLGAILLSVAFSKTMPWSQAISYGVFHSISSFCNAGFDIIGSRSLIDYGSNWLVILPVMFLIVVGGLGFTVLLDLWSYRSRKKLSLHSKLVLWVTLILILFGFLSFYFLEYDNPATLGEMHFLDQVSHSLFQSVTPRTAGFATLDQADLKESSLMLTNLLMFVGGSPASTAGGVKTTTIAVVLFSVFSVIKGKRDTEVLRRSISHDTLRKTLALLMIGILLIFTTSFLLSILEEGIPLNQIVFETVSALGTVGLSTGITGSLSAVSKFLLMVLMFFGRVGPITMMVAIGRKIKDRDLIHYPKERIHIG